MYEINLSKLLYLGVLIIDNKKDCIIDSHIASFDPEINKISKNSKNYRSDVRSSLTYPPTYIRYHQMQLDIPTYLKI